MVRVRSTYFFHSRFLTDQQGGYDDEEHSKLKFLIWFFVLTDVFCVW